MTAEDKLSLRGQLLAEIEQAEDDFAFQRDGIAMGCWIAGRCRQDRSDLSDGTV